MMNLSILAKNIRHYRKKCGMTQLDLSERLYIAPQTVSKWESGLSEPDAERLCMLADIFGISIDNLVRGAQSVMKDAFIAIDGGGTKTEFVLFLETGEILNRLFLEGSNPNAVGAARSAEIMAQGIEKLLCRGVNVTSLFAGVAGAGVGNHKAALLDELHSRFPYMKIRVDTDLYNVISSVKGADRCIAAISGTGACVCAYDGENLRRAGGWGYIFDEAGSGFDIGRDALRHCLAVDESECEGGELYAAVSDALGGRVLDKLDKIYAAGKDYIASFAPIVFSCYKSGDEVAVKIIKKTTDRLSELVNKLSRTYECGNTVIVAGGITAEREIIEPLLSAGLDEGLTLVFPKMKQIYGAAVMCMKQFSKNYDEDTFEANFYNTLNK